MIPNYTRVTASAKCCSSNHGAKPGDGIRPSPGWEKRLIAIQKKQDDPTCIVGSRAAAGESRKRLGKTNHPAHPSLCARHADNDISFIL